MSVCSIDEWLRMELDYHKQMVLNIAMSLRDYEAGEYWHEVDCIPAYADMGDDPVTTVGKTGEACNLVTERCKKLFSETYRDPRPYSMMRPIKVLCFKNGYKMKLEEPAEGCD